MTPKPQHGTFNDEDTCRPGDLDPTTHYSLHCWEPHPCHDCGGHWFCTREPGHQGQHVAGNGSAVMATWPKETT